MHFLLEPFAPPFRTLRHYSWHKLRKDLLAGATVSVVEVPQAMAYALIAGVPPEYGLYTSIIQGVIGALLSSSEHMTTGPTNTQSLLIASAAAGGMAALHPALAPGTADYGRAYLELVFVLTLLKGLIQLAFAAARLGDLVRYVSRSVIAGLTAGAGVLIIAGQLGNFLGVQTVRGHGQWPGLVGYVQRLAPAAGHASITAALLGCLCVAVVLVTRRISRLLPGALLAVILGAAVVATLSLNVPIVGRLPTGFAHLHAPQVTPDAVKVLFGGALALAVMGMIESVAIAKSIAAHTGETISANQEFFAQGFKNALSSFLQCMPGSGSFTRSALDYAAGAETRFAAVFNALLVAAIYFLFAPLARHIPLTALAAVLLVVAVGLIDFRYMLRVVKTSRADASVLLFTFLATLLAPLEYAIFIGVFLNVALFMRSASRLQIAEMVPGATGRFREVPLARPRSDVMLLQLEGNLFFGLADELEDKLQGLAGSGVQVVVVRLKRVHAMDATVLGVLERFVRTMRARGGHVLLAGVKPEQHAALASFGLLGLIGPENVFQTTGGVFEATRRALDRAGQLAGASRDLQTREVETFVYEI